MNFYGSCIHKKVYRNFDFVKKKADALAKEQNKTYAVYLCPYCLHLHLTSHVNPNKRYEYITKG